MNARVDFIDLDEDDSSPHVYEQITKTRTTCDGNRQTGSQSCQFMKIVKISSIVALILIVLVLGWAWLFRNSSYSSTKEPFNSTESNASIQMYHESLGNSSSGMSKDQVTKDQSSCDDGWTEYKDEKCFKILDETFQTFDEAVASCGQLKRSNLPIIHSTEEQHFLTNYLFVANRKVEGFWIGAKFASHGSKFLWTDFTDFSYTNWNVAKDLKNRPNFCVQMQAEEEEIGRWISVPCGKKNAVVCQKMQTWSMARMQKTQLFTRKQLAEALVLLSDANRKISALEHNLEESNHRNNNKSVDLERNTEETNARNNKKLSDFEQNLEEIKTKIHKNLIPVGFIYAQVPNERSPSEIWPWMAWTDVSSAYAGLFFRITGGGAESFGTVQEENCPRITHFLTFHDGPTVRMSSRVENNNKITGAQRNVKWNMNGIAFTVATGEVRPRNMAIRIWKRTA